MSEESVATEVTERDEKPAHWFKPGQSGNPAGRPKGIRNKFTERFIWDLYEDWQAHGMTALERCRTEQPWTYVKIAAQLMPKDIQISADPLDGMTYEQIVDRIERIRATIRIEGGGTSPDDGAGEAEKVASPVHALPR